MLSTRAVHLRGVSQCLRHVLREPTGAARLLAPARQAGTVYAPSLRIGSFMVVDEADRLRLRSSGIRRGCGSTLIHEKMERGDGGQEEDARMEGLAVTGAGHVHAHAGYDDG
jgi:hypothetical protein